MCAFWVSKNPEYSKKNGDTEISVQEYIAECLGDYAYAIFGEENLVQVMIKCTTDLGVVPDENSNDFAVIRALEEALTRIYENKHLRLEKNKN